MNIFADESVDRQIVERLRREQHNVDYVPEMASGISDDEVLNWPNRKGTFLITADKDFGNLVFRNKQSMCGILLIRLSGMPATEKAERVAETVQRYGDEMLDRFSVLTKDALRIRKISL